METIKIIAGTLNVVILAWLLYSVRNLNVKATENTALALDVMDIQDSMDIRFDKTEAESERRLNTVHNKMHQLHDDTHQTLERMDDKIGAFEKVVKDTTKQY
tara:strand:- start:60 stop:365 length:306 start_codon:yes stop_codon:yes gene_type:complete